MRRLQVGLRFATICIGSGMSDIGGRMRVHIAAVLLLTLAMIGGLLLYASTASAAATNKDAVAVIIGNKDYTGTVPDVDFAHNDARAMKRFVIDVLGFREGNIIDLRDATKGRLDAVFGTSDNVEGQLHDWVKQGKSDVVVFYSGHGVPGLKDRRGLLGLYLGIPLTERSEVGRGTGRVISIQLAWQRVKII